LAAGRYILRAAKAGLPRLSPRAVTVRSGSLTRVTLVFDTGLR
jgi:hypothetical protein